MLTEEHSVTELKYSVTVKVGVVIITQPVYACIHEAKGGARNIQRFSQEIKHFQKSHYIFI